MISRAWICPYSPGSSVLFSLALLSKGKLGNGGRYTYSSWFIANLDFVESFLWNYFLYRRCFCREFPDTLGDNVTSCLKKEGMKALALPVLTRPFTLQNDCEQVLG